MARLNRSREDSEPQRINGCTLMVQPLWGFFFPPVLAVHAAICVFVVLTDSLVDSNVLFCFTWVLLGLTLPIPPHFFTTVEQSTPLQVQHIYVEKRKENKKILGIFGILIDSIFNPCRPTYNSFTITSARRLISSKFGADCTEAFLLVLFAVGRGDRHRYNPLINLLR